MGALVLLIVFALMWLIPTEPAALGFSEAEIAFLFPAPVTRRALVHFKLLNSQFRTFFGAALMMLFSNRPTYDPNHPVDRADQTNNLAIQSAYEPGSTLKAITVAAALEQGVIREHETLYCEKGRWQYTPRHVDMGIDRDHGAMHGVRVRTCRVDRCGCTHRGHCGSRRECNEIPGSPVIPGTHDRT